MAPSLKILAAVVGSVLAGCSACENEVQSVAAAPDGQLEAVVFARGCGATVGSNTQLSVVRAGKRPTDAGNVAIVDGKSALSVRWLGDRKLEVTRTKPGNIYKHEAVVNGVEVHYAR